MEMEECATGQYVPWLADSWQPTPDGRTWKVALHHGVQFHHGYGEFTAKDMVHTHALWCDDTYPGRKDLPTSNYRNGICMVERIEVVHDYAIVMHSLPDTFASHFVINPEEVAPSSPLSGEHNQSRRSRR
jgi:ABC-type transport system substrate-binding protein